MKDQLTSIINRIQLWDSANATRNQSKSYTSYIVVSSTVCSLTLVEHWAAKEAQDEMPHVGREDPQLGHVSIGHVKKTQVQLFSV